MVGTVAIWNGTSWYGDEVGGGATSLDCCTLTSAPIPPVTPPVIPSTSCQNINYPTKNDGYVKDDTASVTKYCSEK